VGQPVLATVAIDEAALNDSAFDEGGFLDTIVDQITSREGVDGVYLLVAQTHANHPFATDSRVLRTYLHLTRAFRGAGYSIVLTNFAGVFGQVCIGAGATGFAAGPSHSTRRLSLEGFDESRQGRALPKLFSRRTIGEYLSESHLDPIVARRLLRRVRDVTPYSEALMEVLAAGGSAAQVPEWAESQNNISAASMHFVSRLASDARRISKVAANQRYEEVRDWLEDAAGNSLYIESRMSDESIELTHAPCQLWIDLLDQVV
jgi:hypothetical protein